MAIPIPPRPSGYRRGNCNAPLQIEAFIDVECPFSKKAWSTLLTLADHYSSDQASITVHAIVLADHRQSWDITRAAVAIAADDAARFWEVATYLYERHGTYANQAFDQHTREELYELLAKFAADLGETADKDAFIQQIRSDRVTQKTKTPIRFAISRGVWSTPTFFVNGSEADKLSSSSTLADWQAILDPLLSSK